MKNNITFSGVKERELKILLPILCFAFFSLGATCFGQTSASATFTASATIIQPIGITTTSNMNFAGIDAKSGGTVVLTPQSTRSTTGGVLLADQSFVSAASFEVTGETGFAFSISLPREEYVLSNGTENMILRDFTSSIAGGANLGADANSIRVGATLEVNPDQTPGRYASTRPMAITVAYN